MAPICTPGHTDPSQDLLEEVRATAHWGNGAKGKKMAVGSSGDLGNAWMRPGVYLIVSEDPR